MRSASASVKAGGRAVSVTRGLLSLGLLALLASSAAAGEALDRVSALLSLDGAERTRLLAGEIVTVDGEQGLPNELAASAVWIVKASPDRVREAWESGSLLDTDPRVQAHGLFGHEEQELLDFDDALASELHGLLRVKPGARFNFSEAETRRLRATSKQARLGRTQRHPAVTHAMWQAWRGILDERGRAYFEQGLEGVPAYSRGDGRVSEPARELATALASEPLLSGLLPELQAAMSRPPMQADARTRHHGRWLLQDVANRAQLVLLHQAVFQGDAVEAIVERQFFVGHTYNSLQAVTVCLPLGESTLVVHANRTYTDAVAGFASGLAREVGQSRLRGELEDAAHRLRELLLEPPTEVAAMPGSPSGS